MTTTFDKREEGFEKQFAHDEELRFKAYARRNKMLGLWAAQLLGKTGADAETYAKEVVLADFEEAGHEDVVRKVVKDLADKGVTEEQVRTMIAELLAKAIEQIKKSRGRPLVFSDIPGRDRRTRTRNPDESDAACLDSGFARLRSRPGMTV